MSNDLDSLQLVTDIMRLNDCKTFGQVNSALFEISSKLGFDAFMYGGRFHIGGTRYVERIASNYNASWLEKYETQRYAHIDPTVSHALSSLCPLVWSDDMYKNDMQHNFKEEARMHGLAEGMTLPVHSRNGDVAMLSLAVSRSGDEARRHVHKMLTFGSLLATLTHEAMRRIVKGQHMEPPPKLTKRQIEVLQWVAAGKSTWEISKLVGISEHGVIHHVRNILLKFDVASRHQAVAKAIALGLL
ncbi:MAG TPA: LuxR family transcriptional regulator [Paucimonas sp.]|nr:LuxR family transcriptional regulator [Paucimonas sp.]